MHETTSLPALTGATDPVRTGSTGELKPGVTVLVISYNTRALTLTCLETLYAQTRKTPFEVIVWDNASSDGSADAIAARFPQLRLIRSPANEGFARANNNAAAQASTEWLLLLNPDTEILDGAVDRLVDFATAHPGHGIYGGRTVFPDGTLNRASCWMRITPWSAFCSAFGLNGLFRDSPLFNREGIGGWERDSVREVDIVVGCFFLIRTELWRALGGFDDAFWMYGEESDLCLRAIAAGARPVFTPEPVIIHLGGASHQTRASHGIQLGQARATLMRRHFSPAWRGFGLAMLWFWAANRRVGTLALRAIRGERKAPAARAWAEIWSKRHNWLSGY